MIYIKLSGRVGNHLFQIAAGASLAKANHTDFRAFVPNDGDERFEDVVSSHSLKKYVLQFKDNILKNVSFIDFVPPNTPIYKQEGFEYTAIPYIGGDLIIDGYFQSEKYFDKLTIENLFACPAEFYNYLYNKHKSILDLKPTAIHVRRGDFLKSPHRFHITSLSYYKKAIKMIGEKKTFLIISDDINWCKKHFKGKGFFFSDGKSISEDFYIQGLCANNILSNSTFSWWGGWLNKNPDKKIIYPVPWFGRHFSNLDTKDLIPNRWIKINDKMSLYYRLKSIWIRILMKFNLYK